MAVHQAADGSMIVYGRRGGTAVGTAFDFFPFFFLSDPYYLKGFTQKHWIKELAGNRYFRYLCAFERWSHMWDAVREILGRYNAGNPSPVQSYSELPVIHLRADPVSQFLMQTGLTLFKGMAFDELHRMQIDLETYSSHRPPMSNARNPDDKIILIALSDNRGWTHVLDGKQLSEKELLLEFIRIVNASDPDVLEGHNIFGFDFPYLLRRCALHDVSLSIGRDGSVPVSFDGRMSFAERSLDYTSYEIAGRHVIDTLLLLQGYDASKRTLESYGLKYAAQYFGFMKSDRVHIAPERISWYWDNEPATLQRYAQDDVEETRSLSALLSPSIFYLTQMVPFNYGTAARLGSSAKIESLLVREYLRRRESLPNRDVGVQTTGGYSDVLYTGVLGPILDVDVESLYPSIMLTDKIHPRSESLGIFLPLLEALTSMRLEAKRQKDAATTTAARSQFDAMQSSYKILINSFYGYLGYNRALFSDYFAADRVTQTGQRLLRQLMVSISQREGKVVEVDTDGILFVPPPTVAGKDEEQRFVKEIAQQLPKGIRLLINGRYESILSYKKKNYALRAYDGTVKIRGSSLNSRSIERFGRLFIEQCIRALLQNDISGLHGSYLHFHNKISEHKIDIADLCRTETLRESEEEYLQSVRSGERNRAASYEVAIAENLHWRPGERISYYITGSDEHAKGFEHCKLAAHWDHNFPDENTRYYLKRLDEHASKFEVFFLPQDFQSIFSVDNLFGFNANGVEIQTRMVKNISGIEWNALETEPGEPTILLDE